MARSGLKSGPRRQQKPFLKRNKKFTGILLLIVIGSMAGVHAFMWSLWDKTCIVSCDDKTVGCFNPVGYLALFGPCHYYDWKINPQNLTQSEPLNSELLEHESWQVTSY